MYAVKLIHLAQWDLDFSKFSPAKSSLCMTYATFFYIRGARMYHAAQC